MTDPSPPPTLGRAGRDLWHLVQAEYEFGPGEDQLLEAACFAHQRHLEAQAVIDLEGVVVSSPQGQKANPAVAVADRCAQTLARCLRQLHIELRDEDVVKLRGGGGRPAVVRRRKAA